MQRLQPTKKQTKLPAAIVSPRGKLVYFYLDAANGSTLDELQHVLGMKKIDVLSVIRSLSEEGVIERRGDEYFVSEKRSTLQ